MDTVVRQNAKCWFFTSFTGGTVSYRRPNMAMQHHSFLRSFADNIVMCSTPRHKINEQNFNIWQRIGSLLNGTYFIPANGWWGSKRPNVYRVKISDKFDGQPRDQLMSNASVSPDFWDKISHKVPQQPVDFIDNVPQLVISISGRKFEFQDQSVDLVDTNCDCQTFLQKNC